MVTFVFQRVTIAGLAVNLVAIPCMAVVQMAAMLTSAADAAGIDAVANVDRVGDALGVSSACSRARALVDAAPWLTWRVPSPHMLLVIALLHRSAAGFPEDQLETSRGDRRDRCCSGSWLRHRRWRACPWRRAIASDVMDVGQGDAILVTLPNGRTLMVDTGGVSHSRRLRHRRSRSRSRASRARHRTTRLPGDHARRSRSHRRRGSRWCAISVPRRSGTARSSTTTSRRCKLQEMATRRRAAWRWLQRGDRLDLGGVEAARASPGDFGLATAEGAQRRFAGARTAVRAGVDAADRRHRQGSRAGAASDARSVADRRA